MRFLVVLNATKEDRNAGACKCLLDFFRNGFYDGLSDTGHRVRLIRSAIPGYIDFEIDATALEQLRRSLEVVEAHSIESAVSLVRSYVLKEAPMWGTPIDFPLVPVVPTVLPGPRYGHRIEGKTIAQTWIKIVHRIKTTGTVRPTGYDGHVQELIDLMAIVTDEPDGFYFPEPNYLPCNRAFIEEYVHSVLDDSPYSPYKGVNYTYGQRLRSWFGFDQIEQVIQKLIGEIDAASAVMSLWDVRDHDSSGSPCLNHVWVRVIGGELSLTATFRSNDMFSAWPANAMGLRALQQHIRDAIATRSNYDLKMGALVIVSQSAHLYDDCFDSADRLIQTQYSPQQRDRSYCDPCGNFLVALDGDKIVVFRTTAMSGEVVKQYKNKHPLVLLREICADAPAIQPDHAGYLGRELERASIAVKQGTNYVQDT